MIILLIRKSHDGLELSRFCFCRLNILEVTGKLQQANAEESNPGLYNDVFQVFARHKNNEFGIFYFGL